MELDTIKLFGYGGGFAVAMGLVAWMVKRIFDGITRVMDKLVDKLDAHTTVDLAHHAKVSQEIGELNAKLDGVLTERARADSQSDGRVRRNTDDDITPVETPRSKPQQYPIPVTAPYFQRNKKEPK